MFDNLNQPQLEAVKTTDGPLLVLAGAGTGKTKVLTSRIINILNSNLANTPQILAVTFTNKAAAEMRHRIGEMIGDAVNGLWIGTFHSIAAKITRRHPEIVGLKSDFTIIDQDDQTRLIKQILTDLNVDTKQFPPKNYLNKISRSKDVKVPKFGASNDNDFDDNDYALPKLASVSRLYQSRLKSMNAVDFGDLLLCNLEIFHKNPEILSYYQDKFRYILVDEYQDTNNNQYQWLLKLSQMHKNLCAVGDDDQSIYSWRGANIANILRFEKDFKDAKVIRLEQNYRSTPEILKVADSVISKNSNRHGKTLWSDKKTGQDVKLHSFIDDRGEARFVADFIEKYLRIKKYEPQEVAILVRAGYQTRTFEEAFIKSSIPYRIVGGMKFYERAEIKDAICYLRAICNNDDDLALGRIINVPKRGIGQTSIENLHQKANMRQISLHSAIQESFDEGEIKGKARESLKTLMEQLKKWREFLQNHTLSETARQILEESGYIKMWQAENSLEAQGRLENIDEFVGSLGDFENITEFLEYVSLVEAKDDKNAGAKAVNIMTIHGAKGLEFDLVFIVGLEDGIFPSSRSVDERDGLEEERRLFYVAITRAKKELLLCYAKSRFIFGDYQQSMPSRFLQELPSEIKEIAASFDDGFVGGYKTGYGNNFYPQKNNQTYNYNTKNYYSNQKSENFVKNYQNPQKLLQNDTVLAKKDGFFGKRIFHQKFGYGKIIAIDGAKFEIDFEKTGKKTVMKDFVSFAD